MLSFSLRHCFADLVFALLLMSPSALAQTTAFTYQGKLQDSGNPANGNYDFQFTLFDAVTLGNQQGSPLQRLNVSVANGIFTVQLDFTATVFAGADRFMEIGVRPAGGGAFTVLTPRLQILSAPYAIKSAGAASADTLSVTCVSCVTDAQINGLSGSKISGTIPVASVPAGSANYIQNGTGQQASSNFNISGTGTASTLNATTQYNLGGSRVLSNAGNSNLFIGVNAGAANTGPFNTFVGANAGQTNTTGSGNAFFGFNAGKQNSSSNNSFFGSSAGQNNSTGVGNSFFGLDAGFANTDGSFNAFFGTNAGNTNTSSDNSFFGSGAGQNNTSGGSNSFFGKSAANTNTVGSNITVIGANANVGANNLSFATAIGAGAIVNGNSTLVLGRNVDTVQVPGNLTVLGTLTANIPRRKYYMTSATPQGNAVLTACVSGYHMASLAEIFNMSVLDYATDLVATGDAHTLPDSGSGPPFSSLAFIRVGVTGTNNAVPGNANCISGGSPWSTNSAAVNGTAVAIKPTWTDSPTNISPWDATVRPCSNNVAPIAHVWCVQN